MKKLSRKEWVAVAAAVLFVGYTLFGGSIIDLFQGNMSENSLTAASLNSFNNGAVAISDVIVGEGPEVKAEQLVSVHYTLSLSDGTPIQNSKDFGQPFQFVLGAGDVIPGWEMGFQGMRVGGVRTITIPPELAYGANQVGPIPPNSTLIFTIELLDAVNAPVQSAQ